MAGNLAIGSEKSDASVLADGQDKTSNKAGDVFDAGQLWLAKAEAKPKSSTAKTAPSLPDLDLHSKKIDNDPDHTSVHSVAEDLVDDLHTIIHHNDGSINVRNQQTSKLLPGKSGPDDLPIIQCDGIEPGKMGIIMHKDADGHTYYAPFIAAANTEGSARQRALTPLGINEAAAKELHIDRDLKNGLKPKLDVIAVPMDTGAFLFPRSKDELNTLVLQRMHDLAEAQRDKEAEIRQRAEANLPEPPPPDPVFGYRRTTRSADELKAISANFANEARESIAAADPKGIEDRMKSFGQRAQKDIDKYQSEIGKNKIDADKLQAQEDLLTQQSKKIKDKSSEQAKALDEQLKALDEQAKGVNAKLQTAQYNLSYAQVELKISKDVDSFTRHMQAVASAAAIMSLNPDMEGALTGHYVVVNSGHYPEDPKFPGFEKDDTAEWKLNFESEDVAGAMIKMAGGAVKLVNQADLKDKSMTGLANAIKVAKPEAAIAIHHDDGDKPDDPAMYGTLTLQCAKDTGDFSLDLAKAVHMAKLNYASLPDRVNAKGVSVGIREQCGRGVQGRNVDAPFILDEQASTHKDMWPMARDPKVNAEIQFAHVASLYEFLNHIPRYKTSQSSAQLWKDQIWSKTDVDDVFKKHPKVGAW